MSGEGTLKHDVKYSITKYILLLSIFPSLGVAIGCWMLLSVGFGSHGALTVMLLSLPLCFYSTLRGFYNGLVKYYGFVGEEGKMRGCGKS